MSVERTAGNKMAYLQASFDGLKQSKTAMKIFTYLEKPKLPFDVIILSRGENYGQMLTDQDQSGAEAVVARDKYNEHFGTRTIARPTVLWNPFYDFEYFGDVTGVRLTPDGQIYPKLLGELKSGDYYYQYKTTGKFARTIKVPVVRCTLSTMPAWIVLYHELGHVKQYFEGGNNAVNTWIEKLKDTASIEADNLDRHENPICKEAQLGIREHYKHMRIGFDAVLSAYTGAKAPAFRTSPSPMQRAIDDATLRQQAQQNASTGADTGFFVTP